jgi:glycerol-3-phosphate O-acyltransferase
MKRSSSVPAVSENKTSVASSRHPSSMTERPGRLLTWLTGWLLKSVAFGRRTLDSVRDAESRGSVVYVALHPSVIDYLYFNLVFIREGLKLVYYANGVRTWLLRRPVAALSTLLRGRRGMPDDADYVEVLVTLGQPAMLHLEPSANSDHADPTVLAVLERLIVHARLVSRPVLLLPQLLIWDKRPDRDRATILDDVFGTRQNPGLLRRLFYVAEGAGQAFLNLGQPLVQVSATIDVREFAEQHPDMASSELAAELYEHLRDVLLRERRVIVGPGVKPARQLRDEVLRDSRTRTALAAAAAEAGIDSGRAAQNARKNLDEIAADFSLFAIKVFSAGLTPVWNQIYDGIEIDVDGLEHVRDVARHKRIVLVPSHKSHVDYLVISYVFYPHGLLPPHIAAGVNLSFWPLGPIFRRSGAFFLRRTFVGDPVYTAVFNAYLVKLLEEGFPIEFFIEGTRSRTGKLNPPKYGMLNMIVDAGITGNVEDVAFIPVSVAYENIIEGSSYRQELTGGEKQAENLGALLRTPQVLRSRYGRVYVEFGRAIELRPFLAAYHPGTEGAEIPRPELERTVRRLAYRIIHGINDVTTVSPSALAALILLNSPRGRIDHGALAREAGFVLNFLRSRSARLSRTLREAIDAHLGAIARATRAPIDAANFDDFEREYVEEANRQTGNIRVTSNGDEQTGEAVLAPLQEALRLLGDKKLVEQSGTGEAVVWTAPEDRRIELSFYKNNIVHYFAAEAVFATALLSFRGRQAAVADVREQANFLSRLLKYEYCFEERRRFDAVFDASACYFAESHWIAFEGDKTVVRVPSQPAAGAEFFRALIIPTIEAYWLAALTLADVGNDQIDDKSLTKRALALANRRLAEHKLLYRETTSRATLDNAWRLFREWEILVPVPVDPRARKPARLFTVNTNAEVGTLERVTDDIARLVSLQVRESGELLRT